MFSIPVCLTATFVAGILACLASYSAAVSHRGCERISTDERAWLCDRDLAP